MTVITLGPEWTFSHELARILFGSEEIRLLPSIHAVFEEVSRGAGSGLVPLENSEAGGVGATLNGLQEYPVFITGEAFLEIHHHLAARDGDPGIQVVFAHPQTQEQCSIFLEEKGFPVIQTRSNADSAVKALREPNSGAILSESAADRYGLTIVYREIQNNPHNVTRFVTLSRTPRSPAIGMKCSLLIDPQIDRVGLLHDLLAVFAGKNLNLTRIESRPSRRGMGKYIFFVDFVTAPGWEEALRQLNALTRVKDLGCYGEVTPPCP